MAHLYGKDDELPPTAVRVTEYAAPTVPLGKLVVVILNLFSGDVMVMLTSAVAV
jgi:hypothetical protein